MQKHERTKLAQLIKEVRADRSLRDLARELEVSAVAISSWENCDSVPPFESLEAIARSKGWTIYQLLAYLRGDDLTPSSEQVFDQAMSLPVKEKLRLASLLLTSADVQQVS